MPVNPSGTIGSHPTHEPEARVVAVLDANVLIPPGLRDMLLSCAFAGVFRPVWQSEIEDEVYRNSIRVAVEKHGQDKEQATRAAEHVLEQMRRAFPDACADTALWVPLVPHMTCDAKDRHVLAVAAGSGATHVVTANTRDFPLRSRPPGVTVVTPDRFLREQLARVPDLVLQAVEGMSRRLKSPPQSPDEIAQLFANGKNAPKFGTRAPHPSRQLNREVATTKVGQVAQSLLDAALAGGSSRWPAAQQQSARTSGWTVRRRRNVAGPAYTFPAWGVLR